MLTLLLFPLLPCCHSRCFPAAVPAVTAHLNPPVPIHTIPPALPSCSFALVPTCPCSYPLPLVLARSCMSPCPCSYPLPLVLARSCTSLLVCARPRSFILLVVVLVLPRFVRTTAPAATASAAGTGAAVLAAIAAASATRTPALLLASLPPAGFLVHCCCPCRRCYCRCAYTRTRVLPLAGVGATLVPLALLPMLLLRLLLQLRHRRRFHVAPTCCRCCCHCSYTCTRVLPLAGLVGVSFGTSL
jgi:hypothetical protein